MRWLHLPRRLPQKLLGTIYSLKLRVTFVLSGKMRALVLRISEALSVFSSGIALISLVASAHAAVWFKMTS